MINLPSRRVSSAPADLPNPRGLRILYRSAPSFQSIKDHRHSGTGFTDSPNHPPPLTRNGQAICCRKESPRRPHREFSAASSANCLIHPYRPDSKPRRSLVVLVSPLPVSIRSSTPQLAASEFTMTQRADLSLQIAYTGCAA